MIYMNYEEDENELFDFERYDYESECIKDIPSKEELFTQINSIFDTLSEKSQRRTYSQNGVKGRFKNKTQNRKTINKNLGYEMEISKKVILHLKEELSELLKNFVPKPQTPNVKYLVQIAKAQEFLNENRNADISRVKCLMRKILPKEYHDVIESLKEHQNPQIIYEISGGSNIIAPNATCAEQNIHPLEYKDL